jgi:hypoxanthine phosphoribosyltransferase
MSDPRFAHPFEEALADLYDRHGIRWRYEPHLFRLEQDAEGQTTAGFRPDFFLPDLDLYVECTAMKQSLTTRKKRKARLAEKLYGIVVVILFRRDLERLRRVHGLTLTQG